MECVVHAVPNKIVNAGWFHSRLRHLYRRFFDLYGEIEWKMTSGIQVTEKVDAHRALYAV